MAQAAPDPLRRQQRAESLAATLPPLLVAAERVAATVAQGVHGRRRVGMGESFWQFRRYESGDPVIRIDWRQTAKSQAVFLRETEWEASQSVWLWRDGSPSMGYRSAAALPTKRERAELLLLALAVLLNRAGERVAVLGGDAPPALGRGSLIRLALSLDRMAETASLPDDQTVPRHAGMVVIGDLLSPLDAIARTVALYADRGVAGHLLQVLDPAEEALPFLGRIRFEGFEGETALLIPRVEAVRSAYHDRVRAQQEGLRALARTAGWSFAVHRTDHSATAALLTLWGAVAQEAVG